MLITVRKRSCGKVKVKILFTGGGIHTPRRQTPPSQTATTADDTHNTGMHSCLQVFFVDYSLKISGFDYLGANLTIEIGEQEVIIDVYRIGDHPLILRRNESFSWTPHGPVHGGDEESLTEGK